MKMVNFIYRMLNKFIPDPDDKYLKAIAEFFYTKGQVTGMNHAVLNKTLPDFETVWKEYNEVKEK